MTARLARDTMASVLDATGQFEASPGMGAASARALAEQLHRGQRDPGGAVLLDHIRRVALAVRGDARTVAWLHEALEYPAISEAALLQCLSLDELSCGRSGS